MAVYLLHGGSPPLDYLELLLCRDVYHCTPAELDQQDAARVQAHLACLSGEGEYQRVLAQRSQKHG